MAKNKFWTGFFTVLVVLLIGLTAGWFWGREKVADLIDAYYQKNNLTVTYENRTLTGYPFSFKLLMEKPKAEMADKKSGITIRAHSDFDLYQSYIWNPFKIYTVSRNVVLDIPLPVPMQKDTAAPDVFLKIAELDGSMTLDTSGEAADLAVVFKDIQAGFKGKEKGIAIKKFTGSIERQKDTETEADNDFAMKVTGLELLTLFSGMPEMLIDEIDFQGSVHVVKDKESPVEFSEITTTGKMVIDWMPAKVDFDFEVHAKVKGEQPVPENGFIHIKLHDFDKFLDEKVAANGYAVQVLLAKETLKTFKHKDGYYAVDIELKDGNMHIAGLGVTVPLSVLPTV